MKRGRPRNPDILGRTEGDYGKDAPSGTSLNPGATTLTDAQRRWLGKRAVSALEAWRCCRTRGLVYEQTLAHVAFMVQEHWDRETEFKEALSPGGAAAKAAVQAFTTLKAGPAIMRIQPLTLATATRAAIASVKPQTKHAVEVAVQLLLALSTTIRETSDGQCFECVARKVWGQRKARERGLWKGQSEQNPVKLRIPHR